MPAFDSTSINTLNRAASQFLAGVSDVEVIQRAQLLDAVPAMVLAGEGAQIFLEPTHDFSALDTEYTGRNAMSRGHQPDAPTPVDLPVGENNDHFDMPFRELISIVSGMAANRGNMTDAAFNYLTEQTRRHGYVLQIKVRRQHKRLSDTLVSGAAALTDEINDGADGKAVLDAMFQDGNVDTLVLREDGYSDFLNNAKIKEAIGASNAAQSVGPDTFLNWLNSTYARFCPWADEIKLHVDSLRVKSDNTGDYAMANAMIGLRTIGGDANRGTRADPAEVRGLTRLPWGAVQTYMQPGETLSTNPVDGVLLNSVNPKLSAFQRSYLFSLEHRVARKEDHRCFRHYLDDSHGAKIIRSNATYIRTNVHKA